MSISSRITGWNAVKSRVDQLGLKMSDDQVKEVYVDSCFTCPVENEVANKFIYRTAKIKQLADIRPLAIDDTDSILRSFHAEQVEGSGTY